MTAHRSGAGELLAKMEKNRGARSQGRPKKGGSTERPPKDDTLKLSDLNRDRNRAHFFSVSPGGGQAIYFRPLNLLDASMAELRKKKILCIEDDPEAAALIAEELVEQGYEVLVPRDGREGFAAILKNMPDLVLSDISMPGMSGFELL